MLAEVVPATLPDLEAAVSAAEQAGRDWAEKPAAARAAVLLNWASVIDAEAENLAKVMVREVGKPIGEAKGEVGRGAALLRFFAGEAVHPVGEVIPALTSGSLQMSLRLPVGVVGLITPWNFPVAIPLWKAAPALAYGNAVVLKPSELSPLCADLIFETAVKAGVPAGLFNIVHGAGDIGKTLVSHPKIHAVSFTGSSAVGKAVATECASRNAKIQAEMGGKNPSIVLADANLERAARMVASSAMRFAGQKCTATSRVIVDQAVFDRFLPLLLSAVESLKIGDPADPTTAIGPVITERDQQRLTEAIKNAPFDKKSFGNAVGNGYFVSPTVILDIPIDAELAQKEQFGPILTVHRAEGLDQAIEMANATPFGLSASLFSDNLAAAMSYIKRIDAGLVRVNAESTGGDPHAPFGGVKGSSYGPREQGLAAREFYTETRTIQIDP